MSRVKIDIKKNFTFSTNIPVRITDINYGGHLGNDSVFAILHEARMQFMRSFGYEELSLEGVSLIMADAAVEFKNEAFYGDVIIASIVADEFTSASFNLYYKLALDENGKEKLIALAKTRMVTFCYDTRKVMPLPAAAAEKLNR
jgi:acyl-CoA thioester hydrolase